MTSTDGERIGPDQLRGKPYVLFFGYTFCPDVCPMTLSVLAERLDALGPRAEDLRIVFVTVDPERDTADYLGEYLDWVGPEVIGLRGTAEETAATARAFRATYAKVPLAGGEYLMDHTAALYLMDANGGFAGKLDYRAAPEVHANALDRLLRAD
ncbi:SCO family protein [Cereibacter sp. SYSU M97828]|nr:SCO family protein [Cereibacter flavus]